MTSGTRRSAVSGTLWLGAANLLSKGCQMVLTLALARFLLPSQLGLIALAVSVVTIGQIVQSMGVFDVIAKTEGDPDQMAGTILTLSVGLSTLLAIGGWVAADHIAGALGAPDAAPLVRLVVLSLPFSATVGVQMGLMHRDMDFQKRMLPDVGSAVAGAGIAIALAASGAGAYSLPIGLLLSTMMQPVLALVVGVRVRPRWDSAAALEAMRWIRVVGPGAVVTILLFNLGYVTVGRYLGPDAVGIYALAFRIALVPYMVVTAVIGTVAFPLYMRMSREEGPGAVAQGVLRMTHLTVATAGGLYLLLALMADHVVVISERWAPSAKVLVILCVFGVADSLIQPWYSAVLAAGRPRWFLILQVGQIIVLGTLLVSFVAGGVDGAAWAHLLAAWAVVPVLWIIMVRIGTAPRLVPMLLALRGPASAAVVTWLVHEGLSRLPLLGDPRSLTGGILEGVALVTVYVATLLALDAPVRQQVRRFVRR